MDGSNEFFSGYIEGYFGRELNWTQRADIITHLSSLGMNAYLYAPKEDPYHRVRWKTPYPTSWQDKLKALSAHGQEHGVSVIPALAPGLSYDYLSESDYKILVEKFTLYFSMGINHIALLMDDISEDLPGNCQDAFNSLGAAHGLLLKRLLIDLKRINAKVKLWFCPTIYTDQFVKGKAVDHIYIQDLQASMPESITLMWTGTRVVSESLTTDNCGELVSLFKSNVLFWDNLYANDYAPLRIFVGAFEKREQALIKNSAGIMINPTGLPLTDKFLLSLFDNFLTENDTSEEKWVRTAKEHGIPDLFIGIKRFFWLPFLQLEEDEYNQEKIISYGDLYNDLIVAWVHPLKMEWFPQIHALHLDFLYLQRDKKKRQPWVSHRYPPVISDILGKQ